MNKRNKPPAHKCRECAHFNTTAYGQSLPVCYKLGASLNGKLVGKRIAEGKKACTHFEADIRTLKLNP